MLEIIAIRVQRALNNSASSSSVPEKIAEVAEIVLDLIAKKTEFVEQAKESQSSLILMEGEEDTELIEYYTILTK